MVGTADHLRRRQRAARAGRPGTGGEGRDECDCQEAATEAVGPHHSIVTVGPDGVKQGDALSPRHHVEDRRGALSSVDAVPFDVKDERWRPLALRHGPPRRDGRGPRVRKRGAGHTPVLGWSEGEPLPGSGAYKDARCELIRPPSRLAFKGPLNPKPNAGRREVRVPHRLLEHIRIGMCSGVERNDDQRAVELVIGVGNAFQAL